MFFFYREGPDNTPQKSNIYIGFGNKRPIRCIIATPKGSDTSGSNTIAIRNIGPMEYPVQAYVEADHDGSAGLGDIVDNLADMGSGRILQGGSIDTFPLGPAVSSCQAMLTTDGRPLKATLELLQGPNSVKIKIEHYSEDGLLRPLFVIFETPGFGNVVRVMNTAPAEFPLSVAVEPYIIDTDMMM